jgi:exopolyphosphatase/guanosine-5'-triphosphate,3'-diphosphate pyrophosphatase
MLEQTLGYPIEIISGIEEASLTFLGSREDYDKPVIIDIGGGSTEIIQLVDNKEHCISIDIGAVRLTDTFMKQLPITDDALEQAKIYVMNLLKDISIPANSTIIATAGTPTTLAAIDLEIHDLSSPLIHGHVLSIEKISKLSNELLYSELETILSIPGVHPQRADILPAGALILSMILENVQARSCIVSKKGLRYGIVQSIMNDSLSF